MDQIRKTFKTFKIKKQLNPKENMFYNPNEKLKNPHVRPPGISTSF